MNPPDPSTGIPLRVALIGYGGIARAAHFPVLSRLRGVTLAAIADVDAAAQDEAARRAPGIRIYERYTELLAAPDIDAVVIALPSGLHAQAAIEAFERGKHVYLEKPIATTMADGERVMAAWHASAHVGRVGFNYRFNSLVQRARETLRSGAIGELVSVRTVFSTARGALSPWKVHRALGGGVLLDLASHHVDLLRFLLGREILEVQARVASRHGDADSASLQMQLDGGLVAQSFFSLGSVEEDRIEIYGDKGKLIVDRYRALDVQIISPFVSRVGDIKQALRSVARVPYLAEKLRAAAHEPSFRLSLADFVDACVLRTTAGVPLDPRPSTLDPRGRRPPDLDDGLRALAVVIAAEESAATGRTVIVPPLRPRYVRHETTMTAAVHPPHIRNVADPTDAPALTVVFIVPDRYETIRRTMQHVRAQTAKDRLEILILASSLATLDADESELAEFRWVRVMEVGSVEPSGRVRALAARTAVAPVIVFTEDHCFPEPQWAAALIDAHRRGYAAVGPVVRNANPGTMVSWADLLIGYGPWLAPGRSRVMRFLPGHNSSYRRDALLSYGDGLDTLLDAETVLQWDLSNRGEELYLEPAARVAHTNFAYWSLWIPAQVDQGRVFAATRALHWSLARRVAFAAASPLIPLVRLLRIVRDARGAGVTTGFLARVLPTLVAGLALDGAGQMAGYALGAGGARRRIAGYDFHRNAQVERPTRAIVR